MPLTVVLRLYRGGKLEAFNQSISNNIGILVIILGLVAVVALALALSMRAQSSVLSRRFSAVTGENGDVDSLQSLLSTLQRHSQEITTIQNALQQMEIDGRTHYQRTGLVRYDAFDGVAGQQSYSLCLLDANNNGVVMSSLVGTNFSRGYAVEIVSGEAQRKLGDEEAKALADALAV
jgi:hypothetical protein